jgi:hypothetical protein
MNAKWEQSLNSVVLLADRKLTNIFYETPKCSSKELALEQLNNVDTSSPKFLFDGSIFCFPPNLEYEDAKSLMRIRIETILDHSLIDQIPPYVTLTNNDIRENQEEMLDLAREYSTVKITLDEKQFLESAFQNDPVSIQQFNSIRRLISNTPNPSLIISVFAITTLITSLIGGRLWLGVIQWTATITTVTSALIISIILATRMASNLFETIITGLTDELLTGSNQSIDIILQIFNNVIIELTTSTQNQFQLCLFMSLLTLLVTIIYKFMYKKL